MDEIAELLGVDETDEQDLLAGELVRADYAWVDQLVRMRKELGLSQAQVADAMGRSQSVVSDIETMSSDPRLSSLRRYALAIGAAVKHRAFWRAAPHPLVRPERNEPVTARSASAGGGSGSAVNQYTLFVSYSSHAVEVVKK